MALFIPNRQSYVRAPHSHCRIHIQRTWERENESVSVCTYCECFAFIPIFFFLLLNGLSCFCLMHTDKNQNISLHTHPERFKCTTQYFQYFELELELELKRFALFCINFDFLGNCFAKKLENIKRLINVSTSQCFKWKINEIIDNFRIYSVSSFQQIDCFVS